MKSVYALFITACLFLVISGCGSSDNCCGVGCDCKKDGYCTCSGMSSPECHCDGCTCKDC